MRTELRVSTSSWLLLQAEYQNIKAYKKCSDTSLPYSVSSNKSWRPKNFILLPVQHQTGWSTQRVWEKVLLGKDNCLHLPLSVLRNSGRNSNSPLAEYNAEKRSFITSLCRERCFEIYWIVYKRVKAIQTKSDVCCRLRPWDFVVTPRNTKTKVLQNLYNKVYCLKPSKKLPLSQNIRSFGQCQFR